MPVKGWVYVITTRTHDLVKVGYTDRDPSVRALELNDTSSPHPHIVSYCALVRDPRKVEQAVHQELAEKREGKEFFSVSVVKSLQVIRRCAEDILYEEMSPEVSSALKEAEQPVIKGGRDSIVVQDSESVKAAAEFQKRAESERQAILERTADEASMKAKTEFQRMREQEIKLRRKKFTANRDELWWEMYRREKTSR